MSNSKTSLLLILSVILLIPSVAVAADPAPAPKKAKKPKLEYLYVSVLGTVKDPAAASAKRNVEAIKGVRSFTWTAPRQEAKIIRVVGAAGTPGLIAAFERAGLKAVQLPVAQTKLTFQKNLHCNGCVIKVKRALKAVKGTKDVQIAEDKGSVSVVHDAKKTTLKSLQDALAGVGYPVK